MTIYSQLTTTNNTAANIKTEVTEKGQTIATTDTWVTVANKIDKINGTGQDYTQHVLQEVLAGTIVDLYDDTLNYLRTYCFRNCEELKKAEFTTITKICSYAFRSCYKFKTLILSGSFVKLDDINAFDYTQIQKDGIYVPDNLWATYQADPVWSQIKAYVKPMSSLTTNTKMVTLSITTDADWNSDNYTFMEE